MKTLILIIFAVTQIHGALASPSDPIAALLARTHALQQFSLCIKNQQALLLAQSKRLDLQIVELEGEVKVVERRIHERSGVRNDLAEIYGHYFDGTASGKVRVFNQRLESLSRVKSWADDLYSRYQIALSSGAYSSILELDQQKKVIHPQKMGDFISNSNYFLSENGIDHQGSPDLVRDALASLNYDVNACKAWFEDAMSMNIELIMALHR